MLSTPTVQVSPAAAAGLPARQCCAQSCGLRLRRAVKPRDTAASASQPSRVASAALTSAAASQAQPAAQAAAKPSHLAHPLLSFMLPASWHPAKIAAVLLASLLLLPARLLLAAAGQMLVSSAQEDVKEAVRQGKKLSRVMAEARRLFWYHRGRFDRLVGLLCMAAITWACLLVGWRLLSFAGVAPLLPTSSVATTRISAAACAAAFGGLLIIGREVWEAHLHRLAAAAEHRLTHAAQRGAMGTTQQPNTP